MTGPYTDNILDTYHQATGEEVYNGIHWYNLAQELSTGVSSRLGVPLTTVVGVIAALSPNNKWERNITNGSDLIEAYLRGDPIESVKVSTYHTMKDKAWSIMVDALTTDKDILTRLNGQKIKSFYECIIGHDTCCIDGHAFNIRNGKKVGLSDNKTNIGKKLYAEVQEDYVKAGSVLGLKAYEVQAVTWVAWRRIHGIT